MDSIKAKLPLTHPPIGDAVQLIRAETGEIQTVKLNNYKKVKNTNIPTNPSIVVRSTTDGKYMIIEGSLASFLQGHNIYCPNNLKKLILKVIEVITRELSITQKKSDIKRWLNGDIDLMRVDIAGSIKLAHKNEKPIFMKHLSDFIWETQKNVSKIGGNETIYINQSSSQSALKFYDKYKEILNRPSVRKAFETLISNKSEEAQLEIINEVSKLIRVELTLRAPELKKLKLNKLSAWTPSVARSLLNKAIADLGIHGEYMVPKRDLYAEIKSSNHRATLALYMAGEDLKSVFGESGKRTYYDHLRYFIDKFGIDLCLPASQISTTKDLSKILDPKQIRINPTDLFKKNGLAIDLSKAKK